MQLKVLQEVKKNKVRIKTPFVLGANIKLGNCLNLTSPQSAGILKEAFDGIASVYEKVKKPLPSNNGANRQLDCTVIKAVHTIVKQNGWPAYDTVRCAFAEGDPVYPASNFSTRLHIELCVINPLMIQSYFLPRPLKQFNPYL